MPIGHFPIPAVRLRPKGYIATVAMVWLALAAVPTTPGPVRSGLDPGWMAGLHLASANRLVAGTDIVWTYGPLGWLTLPSATGEHFASMLGYRLAMWAFWVSAFAWLAFRTRRRAVVILFTLAVASVTATNAFSFFLPDAQLSLAVLATGLLVISTERPLRYVPLAILGALGGLASVIKFNLVAEAVAVFIGVAAIATWDERRSGITAFVRAGAVAPIVPLSSFAFYAAATGHPEHYVTYLLNALEISSGYSEGMSFPGPGFLVWFALGVAAIMLLVIPFASRRKASLLRGWLPAAAVSFLAFKHGVVRGDIHMLPILLNFGLAGAYLAISADAACDRKRLATAQLVMTALGLWMVLGVAPGGTAHLADRLRLATAAETARTAFDYPTALAHLSARNRDSQRTMLASGTVAAAGAGKSIEVVPYEAAYVWANGWRWRPRPIFQTYQVCSATHDSLNAVHLAGPRAAELILFHWDPIDERHPLFVDPLSWRATLDHYNTIAFDGKFLALGRRDQARFAPPIEISTTSTAWNRAIIVPSAPTPLLLAADIPRSAIGHLANLFYRVDPVWLEVTGHDNDVTRWRFMRANLPHGVLIKPFPANIDDLAQLAGPELALQHRAIAVRFIADNPGQFASNFQIRWLSLPLARRIGSP